MDLAWHSATLNAFAFHKPKGVPKLATLLHTDEPQQGRKQTAEEQIAVFKSILSNRKR